MKAVYPSVRPRTPASNAQKGNTAHGEAEHRATDRVKAEPGPRGLGAAALQQWERGRIGRLLRHRLVEALTIETILPTAALSVYDLAIPCRDLLPAPGDAEAFVREVERRYPDLAALEREVACWGRCRQRRPARRQLN